jgi:hypothetical protein
MGEDSAHLARQLDTPTVPCRAVRHVLFFDGTGNDFRSRTNIWKLHRQLAPTGDGTRQVSRYWEGVGVRPTEKIRGGAFGRFLSRNLQEGYRWLANSYADGDQIYIFGFSRGAFTAIGLAGLLAWRGLPKPGAMVDLDAQFRIYLSATQISRERGEAGTRSIHQLNEFANRGVWLPPEDRDTLRNLRQVPIKLLGLFDTVRAAGLEVLSWCALRMPPEVPAGTVKTPGTLALRYTRHVPPNVEQAFHALAVDEHRAVFHPRVWIIPENPEQPPPAGRTVEQRWFTGAHANVGGGYGDDDLLAKIPLRWMREKAIEAGLRFLPDRQTVPRKTVVIRVAEWLWHNLLAKIPPLRRGLANAYEGLLRFLRGGQTETVVVRDSYAEWLCHMYRLLSWRRFQRPIVPPGTEDDTGSGPTVKYELQVIDDTVWDRVCRDGSYRPRNLQRFWDRLPQRQPSRLDR